MFPTHLQLCFWLIAIFLGLIFVLMLVVTYKVNDYMKPLFIIFDPIKKFIYGASDMEKKIIEEINVPAILSEINIIKQKLKLTFQDMHWSMVIDWVKNLISNFSYYDELLKKSSAIYEVSKVRFLAALIISAIRKMISFSKASISELIIDAANILGELEKS